MNREVEYPLPKVDDPLEVFDRVSDAAEYLSFPYPVETTSIREPSVKVLEYIAKHRTNTSISKVTGIKGDGLQACYRKLLGNGLLRILKEHPYVEVTDRGWAFLESIGRLPEEEDNDV